jgi:hypothetical protein
MRHLITVAVLASLAGCDQLANVAVLAPVAGSGGTLHGTVSGATDKTRVGLLASPTGSSRLELSSTSASNGSYALALSQPGINMLEAPAEDKSYVFVLTAYEDLNGNGRFDESDRMHPTTGGSYRWFANSGPANATGWNVFKDGVYSAAGDTVASL